MTPPTNNPSQRMMDDLTDQNAEIRRMLGDPSAPPVAASTTIDAETATNQLSSAGLSRQDMEAEILALEESRSQHSTSAAENLLAPIDHLRICSLAVATGDSPAVLLHELLHPVLTRAERKLNLMETKRSERRIDLIAKDR
jgi:hypothetical protein